MEKEADPQFYTKAGQLCVVWRDTKPVTLLTNVGDCTVTNHQMRSRKDATGYCEVKRPDIVIKYNKYMGGSDLAAQLCQYYTHHHRSLKWWKRVFVNILDICLLNANVVHNSIRSNDRVSSLDFRVKVIEGLPIRRTQRALLLNCPMVPTPLRNSTIQGERQQET